MKAKHNDNILTEDQYRVALKGTKILYKMDALHENFTNYFSIVGPGKLAMSSFYTHANYVYIRSDTVEYYSKTLDTLAECFNGVQSIVDGYTWKTSLIPPEQALKDIKLYYMKYQCAIMRYIVDTDDTL